MTPREARDRELERALRALAARVDYPPERDVRAAVRARLEASPPPTVAGRPRFVYAAGFAATVLLVAAVLTFSPAARDAVADLLGVRGVDIEVGDEPTWRPGGPGALPESIVAGERASLAAARRRVAFDVAVPEETLIGRPARVFLSRSPVDRVTFTYAPADDLPRIGDSNVGLLVTQFVGDLERPLLHKLVGEGATVEPVEVNGARGYWVEGEHLFFLYGSGGEIVEDTVRLSDSALLWQEGDVTRRIEAEVSKADALRIGESMR